MLRKNPWILIATHHAIYFTVKQSMQKEPKRQAVIYLKSKYRNKKGRNHFISALLALFLTYIHLYNTAFETQMQHQMRSWCQNATLWERK